VLRSPLDALSTVLFPSDCRLCSSPLTGLSRIPICKACWNQLPTQLGALCACCGENLGFQSFTGTQELEDSLCRPCTLAKPQFEKAVAHGVYAGHLRAMLHLMKYDGLEPIANRLGSLLVPQILAIPDLPKDLLAVPVPLFRGKRRQRGFNQSDLLARATVRALKRQTQFRVKFAPEVLERQRATESQAGLSPHQRRVNMRGAFLVPRPERIAGWDILLIDDIYTTGATARACSLALKRAGAASVWVATVARAQKYGSLRHSGLSGQIGASESRGQAGASGVPMHEDIAIWDGGQAAVPVP
jgi:ComF family protein